MRRSSDPVVMAIVPLRRVLRSKPAVLGTVGLWVLVGAVGTGCGGDDHGHGSTGATVEASADAVVVVIDADAPSPGTQTVSKGDTVSLQITSAEVHEFHVHGYDLVQTGSSVTITFVADEAGEFVIENHDTEATVFTLVVG
jgi:hypothetical protein